MLSNLRNCSNGPWCLPRLLVSTLLRRCSFPGAHVCECANRTSNRRNGTSLTIALTDTKQITDLISFVDDIEGRRSGTTSSSDSRLLPYVGIEFAQGKKVSLPNLDDAN
jgi:hypothetical protein